MFRGGGYSFLYLGFVGLVYSVSISECEAVIVNISSRTKCMLQYSSHWAQSNI